MNLDKLFNPKTIAVIGASDRKDSVGYALMNNILHSDYGGIVYPVNSRQESVHAIKAYPSIKEVPDKIDLVLIATPAKTVPAIIEDCGQAGVKAAVIISAGFMEAGAEGERMSAEILRSAKKHGIRIVGPNCLGFIRPKIGLNATFASQMAKPGKIAFISQSGALCTAMLDWSQKNNVGFSYFVSIGSMIDVGFHDLIDYFSTDKETNSILIYMESITDARKFMSAARAFSRTKPIIVLKVGRSEAGAKAARSHTGSLAGNDAIFDAAFERAGIVRVNTTVDLFHAAKTLAMQPRPQNNKLTVLTNAGGPGVISSDALVKAGGEIATLEERTIAELNSFLPASWSHGNPVDLLGDADPERYKKALEICLNDDNTDAILVLLTPQSMTDPVAVAKAVAKVKNPKNKMLLTAWMGGEQVEPGREILEQNSIPCFLQPEDAIDSFMFIRNYTKNIQSLYLTPAPIPGPFAPDREANRTILAQAAKEKRTALSESEAKAFVANYGIPVVKNSVANSADQAAVKAGEIGFPVAMKILSADIIHKTEVGGVKLGISSEAEARQAFSEIMTSARRHEPDAIIEGVLIEGMVKKRYELLIGCKKDPIFGPTIVFGLGGTAVEVFKDTAIGLPPLNMSSAFQLIARTKVYKLLKGYRNLPGADIEALQFLLYRFSCLLADFPEIKELDINPFAVDETGGVVLDAKVLLDEKLLGQEIAPFSHLVISPYPRGLVTPFVLKNGGKVLLRPVQGEDEEMAAEMFRNFSEKTLFQSFLEEMKLIDHDKLTPYAQIDYDREITIVAELDEGSQKKIIGFIRLIADKFKESAEVTLTVADPWQGQGLGSKFLDFILEIAKGKKLKSIHVKFCKDDAVILGMLKKRGFEISLEKKLGTGNLAL